MAAERVPAAEQQVSRLPGPVPEAVKAGPHAQAVEASQPSEQVAPLPPGWLAEARGPDAEVEQAPAVLLH